MEIGFSTFLTDEGISPAEFGTSVEGLGFAALFLAEHTHIPVARHTPYGSGELPRAYFRSLDPFVALSAIAAVTERVRIGTAIALVAQRDPIILAKEVATLDRISGGRFELGVGAGWNLEEIRNHGTRPGSRTRLLRERVLAIKELWTREQAEFHGEFVDFDPVFQWPKPLQRPHPPVLIGGMGPTVLQRVVDYADGWMPFVSSVGAIDKLAHRIAELDNLTAHLGRAPKMVSVVVTTGVSADDAAVVVDRLAELDVHRVIFNLDALPTAQTDALLDTYAAACADHLRPAE
ncbi:LLM class F420-dependent oxidoreductase [Nocardia sp. NBC_01009]|uniref:LLM class F420-dependent oxidoreductase n=1 Tax=Nocardia sp. NBC_01009 TaxID=2975996 RepID=UPI0038683D86|nr:LLM class F420-dependent oxidoreductase [Nocardia sp. NBC_01009]